MHDELCRKCGGILTNWSLCFKCRKPIKRICIQCGSHTDEIIHSLCFYDLETFHGHTPLDFDVREMEHEVSLVL